MTSPVGTISAEIASARQDKKLTRIEVLRIGVAANLQEQITATDQSLIIELTYDIVASLESEKSSITVDNDPASLKALSRFFKLAPEWTRGAAGRSADQLLAAATVPNIVGVGLMAGGGAIAGTGIGGPIGGGSIGLGAVLCIFGTILTGFAASFNIAERISNRLPEFDYTSSY
jgi:hypothetical protein